MNTTGRLITERRKELGYSRAALAKQLGVSDQAVFYWEKDEREPSKALLKKLAGVLGVRVEEFFGETEVRLSVAETQLLNGFRALSSDEKSTVLKMLSGLCSGR